MKKNTNAAFLMDVPDRVLSLWKERMSRGDMMQIHTQTQISRPTINKAIKHGLASAETIIAISSYFSKKKNNSPEAVELEALKILQQTI